MLYASLTKRPRRSQTPFIVFATQPETQIAAGGTSATFNAVAIVNNGRTPSYQWQGSTDAGLTWHDVPGATSSSLSLTGLTTQDLQSIYRAKASSLNAADVFSLSAGLVSPAITITQQPQDATTTTAYGSVTFTVAASVSDGQSPSYQWQRSTDGGQAWTAVSGASQSSLTLSSLTSASNGYQYRVVVSAAGASSVTSEIATLTVPVFYEWEQVGSSILGADGDEIGNTVSMSDDGTVIAAGSSPGSPDNRGIVRVYAISGASWVQRGGDIVGTGSFPNEAAINASISINANGSILACGGDAVLPNSAPPRVRVFEWSGSSWSQKGADIGPAQGVDETVGYSVALSGDGLAVIDGSVVVENSRPFARVHRFASGAWSRSSAPFSLNFSVSQSTPRAHVSISGDGLTAAVSAMGANRVVDGGGERSGTVAVFRRSSQNNEWTQLGGVISPASGSNQKIGSGIGLSANGNSVAILSHRLSLSATPPISVYDWNGSSWVSRGNPFGSEYLGSESSVLEAYGPTVAMSNDGNTVCVSMHSESVVLLYRWNGSSWVLLATPIEDTQLEPRRAVSMNGDGTRIVIGSADYQVGTAQTGRIRVFDLKPI